jgi:hypothetical protein
MYDSSMKSDTYPLAMPADLIGEVRQAAQATGLSMADTMRQSIRLGLPKLKEQLATNQLKPFTKEECRRAFKTPDPEFDAIAAAMVRLPMPVPEE